MKGTLDNRRNRVAQRLCNFILNTVADNDYRDAIAVLIDDGLAAKVRSRPLLPPSVPPPLPRKD